MSCALKKNARRGSLPPFSPPAIPPGLERCAGELVTEMLLLVEESDDPEEAEMRLALTLFPLLTDLYRQMLEGEGDSGQGGKGEWARQCLGHWQEFMVRGRTPSFPSLPPSLPPSSPPLLPSCHPPFPLPHARSHEADTPSPPSLTCPIDHFTPSLFLPSLSSARASELPHPRPVWTLEHHPWLSRPVEAGGWRILKASEEGKKGGGGGGRKERGGT